MARTPKHNGPGCDTPRSRTVARVRERGAKAESAAPAATRQPEAGKPRRALGVTWRLLVVVVVIAVIAVSLAQSLRVYLAQAQEIAQLRADIQASRAELSELEDQIARWDDPDFVRTLARQRLGWVVPGEVGYRVVGVDGEVLGGSAPSETPEQDLMWWEKMWTSVEKADHPVDDDSHPEPEPSPSPSEEN